MRTFQLSVGTTKSDELVVDPLKKQMIELRALRKRVVEAERQVRPVAPAICGSKPAD
jgi:hypothetical protein